ncbi:hypothetical protein ISN45_Aa08g028680 [Arabidopsis thaliana x Arabidopsis arenosa]|uniref:KIB1-4 beta-propeller domain-containing protein n=1 Tax=Arabidopsis thaliana x Arabidopsis arenosa TaxID=1240361 RepID=A0A8T1XLR6_9BRAS|nr:hypothetical protein ISN45_Aa08g028680 [Arabidopsis thaliana x Arabidopsis arenosa]
MTQNLRNARLRELVACRPSLQSLAFSSKAAAAARDRANKLQKARKIAREKARAYDQWFSHFVKAKKIVKPHLDKVKESMKTQYGTLGNMLKDGGDIRIPVSKLLDDAVTRCIVFGTESDQPEDNVDLILALGDKIIEYQEKLEDKQFVDIEGAVKIITLIDCLISKDQLELVKVIPNRDGDFRFQTMTTYYEAMAVGQYSENLKKDNVNAELPDDGDSFIILFLVFKAWRNLTGRFFSTTFLRTHPSSIRSTLRNGDVGYLEIFKNPHDDDVVEEPGTRVSSGGWVATLKEGVVCLQDDETPNEPDTNRKRISLPPFVTLPHCQTQVVTNIAMSSSCPEDDDCVVAVKFLGPQLSLCRPGRKNFEWTNIRITDPCFFNSRVMYSTRDEMFSMPASGGAYIGSWNLGEDIHNHKLKQLRFPKFPEMVQSEWELLNSYCTSEHLVEFEPTGETFLVKWYTKSNCRRTGRVETQRFMVFKIDEKGNAVYTTDIGDRSILLVSKGEAFCVQPSLCDNKPNNVICFKGLDDYGIAHLGD